ncbi:2-octaprenyl-6-methoxyphenyl hydroxylase [Solilutibacter tolerans]|uniref:2-octaprenyl-6-methoxyphenol hydroxylase /2-octaprenyl-3-methyl-6-methoxy-1,4-benzoquinol hydroxylase n=1 Tax=Solilutibacter tolerans TaxID=1604334 RepID=A0A1N6TTM3_9GAMM|nr:2-octaprenyl-6-methoxyphenyl hydroxylase [Lysobacter tolerans]SIQ56587.1 2-octaprenyl-6-methoxyphenol hydroxylase /2-octaprenyl-3-methyl-6-methoxy-1,4-benzoquinol hydroxylase [Lysobacter tolerans]
MHAQHDIVIVGGGLVGASLAIALENSGLDVAMVEAAPPGALPPVFDERNLSLAEASCHALQALKIWPLLQTASPIRRIHASRVGDFGRVSLDASEVGREAFGHVVIARDFGEALEKRLGDVASLTRYRPARFIDTQGLADGRREVRVADAEGEHRITTRLLVGADGMKSAVRSSLGIDATRHDYGQTLFVSRVRPQRPPDGTAWERLGPHGPTAFLPRFDRHYGVVHGVPSEEADAVAALDEAAWLARLQDAFGWRAGRFVASGERSRYPAVRVVAERLTAPRAVLLGNAAQSIHPIGAQGFNLGLRDALTLVEEITAHGLDDAAMLESYAARRSEDRARTLAFSDGMARASSNEGLAMRGLRSLGMAALANVPGLRAQVVAGGMGYRGDVPAMCRENAQ